MNGENIVCFVIGFLFSFYLSITFIYLKKIIPLKYEISNLKDILRSVKIHFKYYPQDRINETLEKRIDEALK